MKQLTIGELKAFIKNLEDKWTALDDEYLGKFEDQAISVWCKGEGYTNCEIVDTECGIMIFPKYGEQYENW